MIFEHQSHYKLPIEWDEKELEHKLKVQIPEYLHILWKYASNVYICEEINYGQWGLVLWNPIEVLHNNQGDPRFTAYHLEKGEIIIGEFKGDLDVVIIRCDKNQEDFGKIIIAEGMAPREEYEIVTKSLLEFLEKFMNDPTKKFWLQ